MKATGAINPITWKIRRIAAGFRQQDLAIRAGMSMSRYSAIERGEVQPSEADIEFIERVLPPLSPVVIDGLQIVRSP